MFPNNFNFLISFFRPVFWALEVGLRSTGKTMASERAQIIDENWFENYLHVKGFLLVLMQNNLIVKILVIVKAF